MDEKAQTIPANEENAQIIRRLGSEDERVRAMAEEQLQQSGLNNISGLIAILKSERQQWRKTWHKLKIGRYAAFGILSALYILWTGHIPSFAFAIVGLPVFLFITGFLVWMLTARTRNAFSRGMVAALSRFDDISVVGPLIAIYRGNAETEEIILPILKRLLPRLQASDGVLLTEATRERLYLELDTGSSRLSGNSVDAEFLVTILKALEQIGDEKALPHVEKLARSAKIPSIRQAAQECLPFLQARAEHQRVGKTLLRPAELTCSPLEMVRPAIQDD